MDFSAAAAKRSYGHFRTNDQNPQQRAEFSGVSGLFVRVQTVKPLDSMQVFHIC